MKPEAERRRAYWARIQKAVDHIDANLAADLPLDEIAAASPFSPYHFHRLFTSLMGETVSQFVQRLRLEKAASLLRAHPGRPVIQVAFQVGYSSPAAFSRAFRAQHGTTPSEWRTCDDEVSKMGTAQSKDGKEGTGSISHRSIGDDPRTMKRGGREMAQLEMDVRVEEIPEVSLAFIRHVGPYAGDTELFGRLFGRLFQWAGPRGLVSEAPQLVTVYHDDPGVTDPEKLRTSVGLVVPDGTEASGEVGLMKLGGGRYAQARFEIDVEQYGDAWMSVYGGWLRESGYEPEDGPPFERYLNDPEQHPEGKHIVEICLPVKAM